MSKLNFFPPLQDKEREVVQLTESIDRDRMLIKVCHIHRPSTEDLYMFETYSGLMPHAICMAYHSRLVINVTHVCELWDIKRILWAHTFLKTMFDKWHMCVCWGPKWTLEMDTQAGHFPDHCVWRLDKWCLLEKGWMESYLSPAS